VSALNPESPVAWRRRTDLVVRAREAGGWVVKDPLALRYFQLGDEEQFVWSLLTGRVTLGDLCRAFAARFAPRQLTPAEAQRFVGQLIQQGLVIGHGLGSAAAVRRRESPGWQRIAAATNVLAIRFRGVDPDRWLSRWTPWLEWIFAPSFVAVGITLILSALGLWLTHATEFAHRWPEELAQWTVTDLWSLAVVLAGVKVLHELGHATACKRYGGEVHELGVMLLVFTPCLYCNVSDAWLLPSRWRRMVISAAGMWVEVVLAAACAWLWWLSEPGWFHGLCLQVVMICGVSTLVFNLNPLLRYDGYFILSDFCDLPNLAQEAGRELRESVWALLTGEPRTSQSRRWLRLYGAASLAYRLLVLAAILWGVHRWLEPQGLAVVAQGITVGTLLALLIGPLMQLANTLRDPDRRREYRGFIGVRSLVALAIVLGGLLIPWPRHVVAPALIEPADARGLFVTVEGQLVSILSPGATVQTGDVVAQLANPELTRRLERIDGELAAAVQHAESLRRRQIVDPNAGLALPAAEANQRDLTQQREQLQADVDRMTIRAPTTGIVWPMPARPPVIERDQLSDWTGSPFESQNQSAWLAAGTQLGWIGPEDRFEATAYVPQRDIGRVTVGGEARLWCDADAALTAGGTVREIAAAQSAGLPPGVAQRLKLPQVTDAAGTRLVGRWYQVRIPLATTALPPVTRTTAEVSIATAPASLLGRLRDWLRETFPSVAQSL
jgi:putative peptide zinc metalloprotease protein